MPVTLGSNMRLNAEGLSRRCAVEKHGECSGGGGKCKCQCHTTPEAIAAAELRAAEHDTEAASAAARKAWDTRRAREGGASPDRGETAPKRDGAKRPEIKPAKPVLPAAVARQLKSEFALLVWGADNIAAGMRPDVWRTPSDRLAEQEITGIVNASYAELEARAPRLLKILAEAQKGAPEAMLLYTLAMIAIPRLANHEAVVLGVKITPEFARAVLYAPLIAQSVANQQQPGASAAGVGAEPTLEPDRANGHGQIDVGGVPAAGPQVQNRAPEQAGFGDVRHGTNDQNSSSNGRYTA